MEYSNQLKNQPLKFLNKIYADSVFYSMSRVSWKPLEMTLSQQMISMKPLERWEKMLRYKC